MHLAKKTGVYNQFDIKYRFHLHQLLMNEEWYRTWKLQKEFKVTAAPSLQLIIDEFEEFCKTTDNLKILELYNFNL